MKPSEMLDLFIENNFDVLPVHKITDLCGIQSKVAQLEAKNAALKRENGRLRDGIRDVRKHIAPMHTAYDMLLILLAQEKGEDDE